MYVVPHFVCPFKTMNDEPICTVYAVNCANFAKVLGFKVQDCEQNCLNPDPRSRLPSSRLKAWDSFFLES